MTSTIETEDVVGLTPAFKAMTALQKWETVVLHGLVGTDERWIDDIRQSLRAQGDTIERLREENARREWQPIETAPKDGTLILAWVEHPLRRYNSHRPNEYSGVVSAHWIDHNGGGWTWHGISGEVTHWQPPPEPPAALTPSADDDK